MKLVFISLLVIISGACNQTEKTIQLSKDKFDAIEKMVGIANWQLVDKGDTSYFYFSRLGDLYFNIYHYHVIKGDSVNTQMNNITGNRDSVIWDFGNKKLLLTDISDNKAIWKETVNGKDEYIWTKKDNLHISFIFPDGNEAIMKRTLPLSTFLVRVKYDYEHGTSFLDSAEIKPKKLIRH